MTVIGWIQIILYCAIIVALAKPLGSTAIANAAFDRAPATYATALSTFGRFNLSLNGVGFAVNAPSVPDPAPPANLPSHHNRCGALPRLDASACPPIPVPIGTPTTVAISS